MSWSSLVSFWLGLLLGLGVFGEFWWGVRVVLFVLAGLCLLLVGKICRSLRTIPGSRGCLDAACACCLACGDVLPLLQLYVAYVPPLGF